MSNSSLQKNFTPDVLYLIFHLFTVLFKASKRPSYLCKQSSYVYMYIRVYKSRLGFFVSFRIFLSLFLSGAQLFRVYMCMTSGQRTRERESKGSERTMSFSLLLSKTFNYHSHVLLRCCVVVCRLIPHCGITHLFFLFFFLLFTFLLLVDG